MRLPLALVLGVAVQAPKPVELVSPAALVSVQRGTLPILICAPHGGGARIPGADRRREPEGTKPRDKFATDQDVRTAELAWIIAERLTAQMGEKPNVVVAQFHRRYADANRSAEEGTDSAAARAEYEAYHQAVRALVAEMRAQHGDVLLIDLHGQAREPDAIVRGTRDGRTVARLVKRAGVKAIAGENGIFGWLEKHGTRVLPSNLENPDKLSDETLFEGGFTIATYGSSSPDGVDAVQIEVGSNLREGGSLWSTGDTLSSAIAAFARAYLAAREDAPK